MINETRKLLGQYIVFFETVITLRGNQQVIEYHYVQYFSTFNDIFCYFHIRLRGFKRVSRVIMYQNS